MEQTFRSDVNAPQTTTPPRLPASIRRTSHVDMSFGAERELLIEGRCRDLLTKERAEVLGAGEIEAHLAPGHVLRSLRVSPRHDTSVLVGHGVGGGFRAKLEAALPAERALGTPLYLLLDELPVAALISGYALLSSGELSAGGGTAFHKSDVCAGWRADGFMMVSIREAGRMPTPVGPPAPDLFPRDDPLAWHKMPPLAAGSMRRRRLVDVSGGAHGAPLDVFAMFRDSHVEPDGVEAVLHEYSLTARIDQVRGVLTDCVATERVLPWNECPAAAASAPRLDGLALTAIRTTVRQEFRGIETCTHLNDLLRSLGDLAVLAPVIAPALRAG